ncbi:GNAT family N-acetyltransferase [Mycobacterium sp. URHB0044]|jgi:ribosomal protein S18 acetylase RimI-like enzyme|uniref:GNAT family N-acetyltransferase n=1 Tax=Mycobacterium sp. URHB0044 TaxID=1380386 RepID=UPI00048BAC7F|nr:GNAT family N-acetyltransferase [Mycobacterium sp. URHB0044]
MTLAPERVTGSWSVESATTHDHPLIADFLATTGGLAGRKFAADSRDVAEHLDGAYPGGVTVLRDGRVRGYAVLYEPHGLQPEILADFVFDPTAPAHLVEDVVADTVARFRREAASLPDAFLRTFIGTAQQPAIDVLIRHGARQEGQFIRTRKPLDGEDADALDAEAIDGLTLLAWPEVVSRGLLEQVRQLQFDTFLEHFGNMSKTPEAWQHHIESRAFTPDFSIAVVTEDDQVVGYVLGSTYTAGVSPGEERSAHTDYIGVRRDQRKRGIGEFLLKKIWLTALRRGFTVASLGTDIHNRSNAHLLYERLGYVAVEHQFAYRIDSNGTGQ